jgi:hypothetical protein
MVPIKFRLLSAALCPCVDVLHCIKIKTFAASEQYMNVKRQELCVRNRINVEANRVGRRRRQKSEQKLAQ